ncbi:nucleoside deaminase [Deinococcus psychrotolerans]|uniref:Nucleoside deaminase n=1 Tax=Deinococcus psychrotolerans TaxID=2489213 RepID=A0A3G8Y867_9DEIO|nr:nucleoside deaminase [Deinococcus psychrotolerans]AZI41558.1 nucleoside deaminase [Deinococcus psychrotolerans]
MTLRAQHWQTVMQEAWEAYLHGSYPIGACVVDENGIVLTSGRNRLGEERRVDQLISGHRLAHAEINALLSLPEMSSQASRRLMLISSVEPCPMCLGAMRMQRINTLAYAAADAYAGHTDALSSTFYFSQKATEVHRAPPEVEQFCAVLLLTFFLDGEMLREHGFFKINQEKQPQHFERALKLHQDGTLKRLWKQQSDLATALEALA